MQMTSFRRVCLFFSVLMIVAGMPCLLMAQNADSSYNRPWAGFGLETSLLAGKVFRHEKKFTLPIPELSTGIDVNAMVHTWGRHPWEQRRKFPTIGLALVYINYGIDSVYGQCIGLYPNLTVPLFNGRNLEWTLRIGDGIGYATKTYSRANPVDTVNVAVGAHINDLVMIMTDLRYHVNEHWDIQAGANITHISNGSFRKPNLGVNMAGLHLGVRYFPVTSKPPYVVKDQPRLPDRFLVHLHAGMSMLSAYSAGGPLYPVYITSGWVSKRWRQCNKAFAGLDNSYYGNIVAYLRNNGLERGSELSNAMKTTVFAGNEFLIGRLGIMLQAGVYLRQRYVYVADVYEKVSGNYYLVQREQGPVKELFLSASLKTHLNVAELGELGVGISF